MTLLRGLLSFAILSSVLLAEPPKSVVLPGESTLDVLKPSTALFDLDRLSARSRSCGVGVVSDADLEQVTTDLERKSARWLVGLAVLVEEYKEIRDLESMRFNLKNEGMMGFYAEHLEESQGASTTLLSPVIGGAELVLGLLSIESAKAPNCDPSGRAFARSLRYILWTSAPVVLAHSPAMSYG